MAKIHTSSLEWLEDLSVIDVELPVLFLIY